MKAWISSWREQLVQARRKRRLLLYSIICACVIISLGLTTYAWARKDISLTVDGQTVKVATFTKDVGQMLSEQGITLAPKDKVSYELATPLKDGMVIEIVKAFPVLVRVDGKELHITTAPATVAEILQEAGVGLGESDEVAPAVASSVQGPAEITVQRIAFKEVVQETAIPYQVMRVEDDSMDKGQKKVVQKGKEGLERTIYKVTYRDGQEIKREVLQNEVVTKPVPERIAYGTRHLIARDGQNLRFSRSLVVTATAYSHTGGRTYSGTVPAKGTVAVDPQVIPLGSKLYIEGYGLGRALDVGSAIKGERIDVFLDTEREAVRWGRRKVKVYVLE